MPIKIPNQLPATQTLRQENIFVMTETRAIKQSMSVFLSTMINMLLTVLFSVPLYVLLVPYSQFFVLLACAYVLVLAAVGALLCYVLRSWGVKKFDSLQA